MANHFFNLGEPELESILALKHSRRDFRVLAQVLGIFELVWSVRIC